MPTQETTCVGSHLIDLLIDENTRHDAEREASRAGRVIKPSLAMDGNIARECW